MAVVALSAACFRFPATRSVWASFTRPFSLSTVPLLIVTSSFSAANVGTARERRNPGLLRTRMCGRNPDAPPVREAKGTASAAPATAPSREEHPVYGSGTHGYLGTAARFSDVAVDALRSGFTVSRKWPPCKSAPNVQAGGRRPESGER
jgi:hypothetical protein